MSLYIGIDFGTSTLYVTKWDEEKQIALPVPNLIPSEYGSGNYVDNVVYYEESCNLIMGKKAVKHCQLDPWNGVSEIKRHLDDDRWSREIRGHKKTAKDIITDIFTFIKMRVETIYGGQEITGAVISVPYAFEPKERKKIETAAKSAGVPVLALIEEPVAAALSSGLFDELRPGSKETVLIFDLGGGTFDVTLFDAILGNDGKKSVIVKNTDGERLLGGANIDQLIADKFLSMMTAGSGPLHDARFRNELFEEARQTKIGLSDMQEYEIFKKFEIVDNPLEEVITRSQLEEWLEGSFLYKIDNVLDRVLDDISVQISEIEQIILVGGTSNIPIIAKRVTDFFGKRPKMIDDPGELVGKGAAIYCGIITGRSEKIDVIRRSSHGFGVRVTNKTIKPILIRNELYGQYSPFYDFSLPKDKQKGKVVIYQGNSPFIEHCSEVGYLVVNQQDYPNGIIRMQLKMSDSGLVCYRTFNEKSKFVSEGEVARV
ncbi:Hsp70 family protein [Peribacillus kribbensis]|uniref:Hsp70 family protein n=1 Tax=Peribacillus kribbensis TaxID=356658 RepID=UPI00041CC4A8|nr:Hsp70 family protein [Peribacillus kribbensis]